MKIADLFVNIGVKGGEGVAKSIAGVQTGLKAVASTSLEAKAALVGVFYAFERLTSASADFGNGIKQFEAYSGLSGEKLQRWQYVLKGVGVDSKEAESNLLNLQKVMSHIALTGEAPAGFADFLTVTGASVNDLMDPYYALEKVKEYVKKTAANPGLANEMLAPFLSPAMIAAFRNKNLKGLETVPKSAIISSGQLERLQATRIGFDRLYDSLSKFANNQAATFGLPVIEHLNKALKLASSLSSYILKLEKSFPIIEAAAVAIGLAMLTWGGPLTALSVIVTGIVYAMGEIQKYREGKDNFFSKVADESNKRASIFGDDTFLGSLFKGKSNVEAARNTYVVNMTNNISEASDAKDIGAAVGKAVSDAFFQFPAAKVD